MYLWMFNGIETTTIPIHYLAYRQAILVIWDQENKPLNSDIFSWTDDIKYILTIFALLFQPDDHGKVGITFVI